MARLTKVISFNLLSNKTSIHSGKVNGRSLWRIEITVTNGIETIIVELENQEKTSLMCMQDLVIAELTEIIGELSPITNGGYIVYQRKE